MKTENIEDIYELSPIQKGILFQSLYEPELGVYFFQVSIALRGQINIVAFEQAWQRIVAEHTALRTGFYWEDIDKPLQVVYRQVKVPFEQHDWREIDPAEQDRRFKSFLESDRKQGFDLSQGCLMRLTLIRLADQSYQFIWSHHFIILDGWSAPLIFKNFIEFYVGFCQGQEVPLTPSIPYRNYIAWLQRQDLFKAEAFWREALNKVQTPTSLTNLETNNLFSQEERYEEQKLYLSKPTITDLQSLARQHHLTLSTFFQGAWAILLSRYSCQKNVLYGCTVSGRPVDLEGAESMVGMLINTLPVSVKVDPDQYLLAWLKQLQNQLVEMRQYEYSPLVEIQGWSKVTRGVPMFESILVFENLPIDPVLLEWQGELEVLDSTSFYKTNYPLTVAVYPDANFYIGINYDFRRFDVATINGILADFELLLEHFVSDPHVLLKDLSFLTKREQQMTLMLEKEVTFNFDFAA